MLFASEGANVLLVDINPRGIEAVAVLIATRYPNIKAVVSKTDVGVEKEIKDAVDLAVKEFGRLDIMVRPSPRTLIAEITIQGLMGDNVCFFALL